MNRTRSAMLSAAPVMALLPMFIVSPAAAWEPTKPVEIVAKGEAELGLQQINVLLPIAGVDYVGPLPGDLQDYVEFAAGVLTVSKEPEAAKAFARFISSAEAVPLIKKSGMEPALR